MTSPCPEASPGKPLAAPDARSGSKFAAMKQRPTPFQQAGRFCDVPLYIKAIHIMLLVESAALQVAADFPAKSGGKARSRKHADSGQNFPVAIRHHLANLWVITWLRLHVNPTIACVCEYALLVVIVGVLYERITSSRQNSRHGARTADQRGDAAAGDYGPGFSCDGISKREMHRGRVHELRPGRNLRA